jgi:hypothetical protein
MSLDPHTVNVLDRNYPYMEKSTVVGRLNCILHARSNARKMVITPHPSRAVLQKEIHELILTDEGSAGMGKEVNHVSYLAFFEVLEGGMILVGDRVAINGEEIGTVAGFDLTHFPNHINLCIRVPGELKTGYEMECHVNDEITFTFAGPKDS